jgi:putative ABC transport system ATP-binding protein
MSSATDDRPLLELAGIEKIYRFGDTQVRALDGLDLKIKRGEFIGVIGRSGSGKSSLLNVLGGLDQPSSGEILVNGKPLRGRTSDALAEYRRTTVGFIFQSFNLVSHLTALENVALPLRLAGAVSRSAGRKRATELLEHVGLGARLRHKPSELSGGERQRVAIARSLANDPLLLLADEPTGNLDSKTAHDTMEMIRDLHEKEKRTVILVTHDRDQAERYCQRVIEMEDGKVLKSRPAMGPNWRDEAVFQLESDDGSDEGPPVGEKVAG